MATLGDTDMIAPTQHGFLQLPYWDDHNTSMPSTHNTTDNDSVATYYTVDPSLQDTFNFQYYAWAIVGNIVSAFGILGNILSIVVLSNKRMMSSTSLYLMALAVFDSLVLISMILFMALPSIYNFTGRLEAYTNFYPYLHPFAYPTALTAQTCSIYITVGFTVERYIAVCHPLKAAKMCTMSRARKSLLAIFFSSVVYNIPRMLEYETTYDTYPGTNDTYVKNIKTELGSNKTFCHIYFIYMHMIVMLVVPFTVLAVLNALLIRAVKHSERASGKVSHKMKRENNLTVMLISVVIVFLICQVPSIIDNIFMATLPKETLDSPPFVKLTTICSLMVVTNSAINFYLYCVFGHKFRRVFCRLFCICYLKITHGLDNQDTLLMHSSAQNSVRRLSSKTPQKSGYSAKRTGKRNGLSIGRDRHKKDKLLLVQNINGHSKLDVKYSHASGNDETPV